VKLVLVCGSRTLGGIELSAQMFDRMKQLPATSTIMHGDARGVDRLAGHIGEVLCFFVDVYPADWERHGKRAGIVRNLEMLDRRPDLVLAFWDGQSKGTKHTIDEAERRGIPVEIVRMEAMV
jgi:hypothetical protein